MVLVIGLVIEDETGKKFNNCLKLAGLASVIMGLNKECHHADFP
jgi:hypothetical protein